MNDQLSKTRPVHGGNLAWAAQIVGCSPFALLDFSASISPLGPSASVMSAIASHLTDIKRYPTPGYGRLAAALADHHDLDPAYILPGNGAAELLTWAGRDLAQLDATYVFTPAFGDYARSLTAFDGQTRSCPLPLTEALSGAIDWTAVLAPASGDDPSRCGLLLNTPHNPTGLLIPTEIIEDWLQQFALVVVDEAFMDFLPPSEQTSVINLVGQFPNLVVLRSLTKFYSLPGLRLGYAFAHPDCLQRWQQWRDPWPVNALAEVAAIAALQDTAYQQATWQWLPSCRADLIQQLNKIPGLSPLPGQANYLLIQTQYPGPDLQIELLKRHHILVRDCMSFAELGDRYIRIAVRTASENQQLITALTDILSIGQARERNL
ncbi:MAG: threonine-phosphate decarboxylase CobD [Cyanobacteria bacterium J06639_14]